MKSIDLKENMSKDLDIVEHLDEINKVVEEYLKGSDPTKISKDLNLPRTRVVAHLNEWKVMVSANIHTVSPLLILPSSNNNKIAFNDRKDLPNPVATSIVPQ